MNTIPKPNLDPYVSINHFGSNAPKLALLPIIFVPYQAYGLS